MRCALLLALPAVLSLCAAEDKAPAEGAEALLKELASEDFARREHSTHELIAMGEKILPVLKAEHETAKDAEAKARMETVLEFLEGGGPVVDGIKATLSASKSEIRAGESFKLTAKVFNLGKTPRRLRGAVEKDGALILSGHAFKIFADGSKSPGFCGDGNGNSAPAATKDIVLDAYQSRAFPVEAEFEIEEYEGTQGGGVNGLFEMGGCYYEIIREKQRRSEVTGTCHFRIDLKVEKDKAEAESAPGGPAAWQGHLQSNTIDIKTKE